MALTSQLRHLVSQLFDPREAWQPSSAPFPPLDVDALARDLKLDARARENGEAELPASDSNAPDAVELEIATVITERASLARQEYDRELALYEARMRRHAIGNAHRAEIEAAGESALADYAALTADDLDHLFLERDAVQTAETEFSAFRERHGLTRAPRLIDPRERLLRILILAILLLAESIANGLFFAAANAAGMIGGVAQALAFAALNLGMALLMAQFFARWLASRSALWRIAGFAGLTLGSAWCLALNLAVAHFRDLYLANAGSVDMTELTRSLLEQPWLLHDVTSWLLAALGVAFALIAFIDARGLRDPYLGYEQVARQRAEALARYAESKSACLAGLMARRDEALAAMQETLQVLQRAQHEYHSARAGRTRLHAALTGHLADLASAGQALIRRYRDLNLQVRRTPAPKWFDQPGRIPPLPTPADPEPALTDADDASDVAEHMRRYIAEVNVRYERALSRYETLHRLTAEPDGAA